MKKKIIVFDKSFLTLPPRLIIEFLKIEVPDILDEKTTLEKWYLSNFSKEVRKEFKIKPREGRKEVENCIRKLIVYKEYLYEKYK